MPLFARVITDLALDKEFDYRIPEPLWEQVTIGSRVHVPFGKSRRSGYVVGISDSSSFPKLKEIESVDGKPFLNEPMVKLARWISDYYASPFEHAVRTMLPGAVRKKGASHKEQLSIQLLPKGANAETIKSLRKKAPAQARLLAWLKKRPQEYVSIAAKEADVSVSVCHALAEKKLVSMGLSTRLRDPLAGQNFLKTLPHELTDEQTAAMAEICEGIDSLSTAVILIHGVTGSGKTEIYLQAIQHALDQDKGSIMLVPEIALTPQMMERFRGRFGESIAVLHSHLSEGERHDEWHRIKQGKARIVLGARSALFAPVDNLGLILLDEEHENTYKQEESPRYHARDVAVMRGRFENACVVLGSATPSIESMNNAQVGKFKRIELTNRVEEQQLPQIHIVDMRKEMDGEGRHSYLGSELVQALKDRIDKREQSILFLNRRGFSTSVLCQSCGHVFECPSCSVALTYHKQTREMICHMCGTRSAPPRDCIQPDCKDGELKRVGLGTQRLEETIQKLFPRATIARMDADSMTRKHAYQKLYSDFRTGKIDILIGTQMIAKGLHFPNVTLVGVLTADGMLQLPDFRSSERTFQLLTQVAGRAGRGALDGEVYIQTYQPENPVIKSACENDYAGFMEREITFRKQLHYPPFTHIIVLLFKGKQEDLVALVAQEAEKTLQDRLGALCTVSSSCPAFFAKIKEQFRYQIVIRTRSVVKVSQWLKLYQQSLPKTDEVKVVIDIDPSSML